MKNLSKILLVILAAALVVSSVATFALASTAEEENLVAAQAKLETVVSASSDSVATYATALADLSAFLVCPPRLSGDAHSPIPLGRTFQNAVATKRGGAGGFFQGSRGLLPKHGK